ncbi:MAG: M20/M25/M40 family metallo-hydrolase [Rhodothermia bacterium]|nr:M20/M25/M40 family metallo-hydrolase [Rhodothermia bacterium]
MDTGARVVRDITVDAVDLLRDMIRFRSVSHEEAEIADYVQTLVTSRGIRSGRHGDNVYFLLGEGEHRLLMNSHLDVVPESSDHPYDPFDPVEVDGRIYGRGAVDAKASGAAMTVALLELAAEGWSPQDGQLIVALTACEELGKGYNGLEDLLPHLPEIKAALVGEPTDLRPCTAQKGLLMLKVHAKGKSAHAGRSMLGENAIDKAARDIARLSSLKLDRSDPLLGQTLITVTTIAGGKATNAVPDRCTFSLDVRSTPAYTHDELVELIASHLESDLEVYSDRLVPVSTNHDEPIVQACIRASDAEPFGSPTMSDWLFLRDLPTVKIGPGSSELSHSSHENVAASEVRRAVRVYKEIATSYYARQ